MNHWNTKKIRVLLNELSPKELKTGSYSLDINTDSVYLVPKGVPRGFPGGIFIEGFIVDDVKVIQDPSNCDIDFIEVFLSHKKGTEGYKETVTNPKIKETIKKIKELLKKEGFKISSKNKFYNME